MNKNVPLQSKTHLCQFTCEMGDLSSWHIHKLSTEINQLIFLYGYVELCIVDNNSDNNSEWCAHKF